MMFDPSRHPRDCGSQALARATDAETLMDVYARIVMSGSAADMQLLASEAIAKVEQLSDALAFVAPHNSNVLAFPKTKRPVRLRPVVA